MIIELLYPEIADLYGEHGTFMLLRQMFHDATIIETQQEERPHFADHTVDVLYLGPSSERHQAVIIEKLLPYKERLQACIAAGSHILFVGNAVEVLGQYVETDKGVKIPCLGLYPFHAVQNFKERLNSEYLGEAQGQWSSKNPVIGFKTQFTACHGAEREMAFCHNQRGIGMDRQVDFEGLIDNNLIAIYLVGPFLVMNPYFVRAWLDNMGENDRAIPFFDSMVEAYTRRLKDFQNPKTYLA